ncbi:MAG: hypothetical protein HKN42_02410 [Granulosicoccus sp.]|nr:hypothetical protein [Granulosicoccus sp.]
MKHLSATWLSRLSARWRSAMLACLLSVSLSSGCQSTTAELREEQAGVEGPATISSGFARQQASDVRLFAKAAWAILPLHNSSTTDTASESATALVETHLRNRGVHVGVTGPVAVRYVIEGAVLRWQYAGNVSPRPQATIRLDVRDLQYNEIVWSSALADKGARRESLSMLADGMLRRLVERMPLTDAPVVPADSKGLHAGRGVTVSSYAGSASAAAQAGSSLATGDSATSMPMPAALGLKTDRSSFPGPALSTDKPLAGRSVAFWYAVDPPVDVLSQFDRLVLEPDNTSAAQLQALTARGAAAYAYLSVGEVGPSRAYATEIDNAWILGANPVWNSKVLDLANPALRRFLIERAGQLHAAGYHGLFLDTLDSFNLVANTDQARRQQISGLVTLVRDLAARYPALKIITNRGFEVLDEIAGHIEAVAAESLYASWNNGEQRYSPVADTDRQWLLAKLEHAHHELALEVIAIDYLPPTRREEARKVAARIAAHGFIPWVASPAFDYVGVGAQEVIPRKVLLLYDSETDGPIEESPVHKFVATPVEYMGFVPEYLDIARQPWPAGELKGRYAGIVTWPREQFTDPAARAWLQKQLDDTVPVAFLSMPPVPLDKMMSRSLGIRSTPALDLNSAQLVHRDEYIQPERALSHRVEALEHAAISIAPGNTVHMSYQDKDYHRSDVVVTGDFGGFAWQPGLVDHGLDYLAYWVVDPFRFLRTALQLPDAPMPDVTSENGRRIWLGHIDGDALPSWAEMPGGQLGAEVIYEQILTKYPLPHTVSIVEGEMTAFAAFDDRRARMFDIAKKTFRLDHVELASHTYSHPFKWAELGEYRFAGKYNLDIKGYRYTPERDIAGSIAFIDRELAPPGKRTKVMLWSGDALPQEADLHVVERLGLPNLNGGLTNVTRARSTLSLVSPMARPVGDYLQVYAPVMNENMYTNDWLGPFDGFKRVIETFQMTESPRRLKPLNVYYHFYSGTKISAMKALKEVYDWSMRQDMHPLHVSDYALKVPDYRQAGVSRYLDGRWKLSGLGHVRSLRILGTDRWPELAGSRGITGARRLHDGIYIHTDGAGEVQFETISTEPRRIHLVSSNGRVLNWTEQGGRLQFRISGEVPVTVELGGAINRACTLDTGGQPLRGVETPQSTVTFTFTTTDTGDAILNCPA